MATFLEKNGRFRAMIRTKNKNIFATFSNMEDAKLWASYKEDLMEQINLFNPSSHELITLEDAIEMKIADAKEKNVKDMGDFTILKKVFFKFLEMPLSEITYDLLLKYFDELMKIPVKRGGSGKDDDTGIKTLPSMHTTFRKYSYLSTVYEHMIRKGLNIQNVPLAICKGLREKLPKKGNAGLEIEGKI